ncbi:MAG: hypothetical protein ABR578_13565 [Chromatocurvus sp.]
MNRVPGACALLPLAMLQAPITDAQLPLSIETLLMPPSTFTLSTQTHWQESREPVLSRRITPSGGALLSIGQRRVEQTVNAVAARYGFAPRWEVNGRLSHRQARWNDPGRRAGRARGFSADVGLSWLVRPEQAAPAILVDARLNLVSKAAVPDAEQQSLQGVEFGVTGYRSLDPVVLSVSARYRRQNSNRAASGGASEAHSLLLAPQVNFAVNAHVTLIGGLSLQYQDPPLNTDTAGGARVDTALRLGLGYAASRHSTIFFNTNIATAGRGSGFDLEWLYRFQ